MRKKLVVICLSLLVLVVAAEGVWIGIENKKVDSLQTTTYANLLNTVDLTVNSIEAYDKNKDQVSLGSVEANLWSIEMFAEQTMNLTNQKSQFVSKGGNTQPAGLVDLLIRHKASPEKISSYLDELKNRLNEFRVRGTNASDYTKNSQDTIALWNDLLSLTSKQGNA